ncbi:MAG: hypothetical protein JO127_05970 [Caulobacteraceae bacterium]|nr:hypothetical protein [Caulobacteraceae bacterium]
MVRKIDLKIDVSAACRVEEPISSAATVVLPDPDRTPARPLVMFGWPGGGYSRRYFDLQIPGMPGYSQAEHHAANGVIFAACDHVAVGDSTIPTAGLDHPDLGRANRKVAATILAGLLEGTLVPGLGPMQPSAVIGMGQSYGGLLLTMAEANEPLFDGVAMLGWSGIQTVVIPALPPGGPGWAELAARGTTHPYRPVFHFNDVPEAIVEQDLAGYPLRAAGEPIPPWGTKWMPGGPNVRLSQLPLAEGVVKLEAAAIGCAVFVGNGERDTCPQPHMEPLAYKSASDVTTFILPRAAHMHNFAGTRRKLWTRLEAWSEGVARMKSAQ